MFEVVVYHRWSVAEPLRAMAPARRAGWVCTVCALLGWAQLGCAPTILEGTFVCVSEQDCPPEWGCHSERCWSAPSSKPDCSGVCGDANQSGELDSGDREVIEIVSNTPEEQAWVPPCVLWSADVTGDHRVDIDDRNRGSDSSNYHCASDEP